MEMPSGIRQAVSQPQELSIMRALLLLTPLVLTHCAFTNNYKASQREILRLAKEEINRREPWADTAAIIISDPVDATRLTWKVKAGALDYSEYSPVYKGTYYLPGTERELWYTRSGCLLSYKYRGPSYPKTNTSNSEAWMYPEK